MKIVFISSDKDRENNLADAFLAGVARAGDDVQKVFKSTRGNFDDGDAFCVVGVKSLKLVSQIKAAGKHVIFFDKGYFRHRGPNRTWEFWRIAVDGHHPTHYVAMARHSSLRWDKISGRRAVAPKSWREDGGHIVYAGSSEKYHRFVGLKDPTEYAKDVISELKKITNRLIVYRPKPTWEAAEPVDGANFSPRTDSIHDALQGAWCLVTNGSNASFDAIIEGVPCVVLGEAIAKPISSQYLQDVENPYLASDDERQQWFSNLAWCMFTEQEMSIGLAWQVIKPQLFGNMVDENALEFVAGRGMRPSKALLKKTGQWQKDKNKGKTKRTKEEQRRVKPFKKGKKRDTDDWAF